MPRRQRRFYSRYVTKEEEKEILRLYWKGAETKKIMKQFDLTERRFYRVIGTTRKDKAIDVYMERRRTALKMYYNGALNIEIAKKINITKSGVHYILKEFKILNLNRFKKGPAFDE